MDLRALGLSAGHPEDNEVRYELYPAPGAYPTDGDLEELRHACIGTLLPLLREHTWQRGRFDLHASTTALPPWHTQRRQQRRPQSEQGAPVPDQLSARPFLWGQVNFSDNIDDEWFIVWLLLQLTRSFPITARVWDNDGEFLLIEAAYSLPKGLKPENAEHRVWLRDGKVHIVPLKFAPAEGPVLSLKEGLDLAENPRIATEASPSVAQALSARLSDWPQQSGNQRQITHVALPRRAAELLELAPQVLQFAVEAFHYRDLDDAKAAAQKRNFPDGEETVLVAVTFSRCLYAQLALQQQHGHPDDSGSVSRASQPERLGSRLTAGLEMLLARARSSNASPAPEASSFADADALSYLALTKALVDSPEAVAAAALLQAGRRQEAGKQVVPDATGQQTQHPLLPEDPLDWLDELGLQLEEELDARQAEIAGGGGGGSGGGDVIQHAAEGEKKSEPGHNPPASTTEDGQAAFDPGRLAQRMRQFMAADAGLEGAEVPHAPGTDARQPAADDSNGALPSLDIRAFLSELEAALGGNASSAPAAWSSDDDDEEGSSFYDGATSDGDDSDGDDDNSIRGLCATAQRRRAMLPSTDQVDTETDSDDEGFDEVYGEVLRQQLAAGAASVREQETVSSGIGMQAPGDTTQPPGRTSDHERRSQDDPLTAPDLDMHLVQSLLSSVESQGGGPGPGSNLAALLGVPLPAQTPGNKGGGRAA